MISVCVIGAGNHSRLHGESLAILKATYNVELAAVCDLNAERAEQYRSEFGFLRSYERFDEMIDRERPDALIAITPLNRTVELAGALMEYRIPLVIEKPPGMTVAQTESLVAVADDTGCAHMVSFNRRFSPALMRGLAWIAERGLSAPHFVSSWMIRDRRREDDFVVGTGLHLIDTVCSMLGEPIDSSASIRGSVDSFFATAVFAEATADICIAPDSGIVAEWHRLIGDGYTMHVDIAECSCSLACSGVAVETWSADETESGVYSNGTLDETRAFLDFATVSRGERAEPPKVPTLSDALQSMRLAQAIANGVSVADVATSQPRG